MNIDLDKLRADRDPTVIIFHGQTYEVSGFPVAAIERFQHGDLPGAVAGIFGADAGKQLLEAGLSVEDLHAIVEGIAGGPGNSATSTGS